MLKTLGIMGLLMICFIYAAPAYAEPIGSFTLGTGNSWTFTWTDTTSGDLVDKIEFFIMAGTNSFDLPVDINFSGWTGSLVNPNYTYTAGTANGVDKIIMLSFTDPRPSGGIRIDVLEWHEGSIVGGQAWAFTDVPNGEGYGPWETITYPDHYNRTYAPVPEGGSISLLLGIGGMALAGLRKWWK
jgi:hypothetical protein